MKRFFLLLIAAALALAPLCSLAAANYGSEFVGYFEHVVNIRANPGDQKGNVGTIPAYTPVKLKPVSSAYAEVTYEGAHGYVYTGTQVRYAPEEKDVDPYILTAPGNKVLWKLWTESAGQKGVISANTPMLVTQICGSYYRVFTVDQGDGYIHNRDTVSSITGIALTGSVFSEEEANAYELPLENAKVKTLLEAEKLYPAVQLINGYYQIKLDDGSSAYILEADARRSAQSAVVSAGTATAQQTVTVPNTETAQPSEPEAQQAEPAPEPVPEVPQPKVAYIARVDQATSFFSSPSSSTEITESVTKGAVVIAVTPAENGYYLWPQKNVYISSDLVDIWQAVERDGSMLIYCTVDINLLQAPDPASGDIGYKLVGGRAYDAKYEMDGYFVIPLTAEGELGFIPMSAEGVYEVPRSN